MLKRKLLLITFISVLSHCSLSAQTQAEMNQKAAKDYEKADAELNKVYKQLVGKLGEKQKKLLVTAQRDWIKFRDSNCKFQTDEFNGGSIQSLMLSQCLTEQTKKRVEDLKSSLKRQQQK